MTTPASTGPSRETPRVSALVPLHRSARHFPILVETLEMLSRLEAPPLEVLVSDRHGLDDTLPRLSARFAADPRFRFLAARDELSWVQHVNLLLREARGEYALVMPHDDSYGPDWIPRLDGALQAAPDALVAFGDLERIDLEGRPLPSPFAPPPPARAWTLTHALRLLVLWNPGIAWRGLVRRRELARHGLFLREVDGGFESDMYWMFAVSLRGRLLHVPGVACRKRFYPGSTHAVWLEGLDRRALVRRFLSARAVLASYLRDHATRALPRLFGEAVISAWLLGRLLRRLLPRGGRAERAVLAFRRRLPSAFAANAAAGPEARQN